MDIDKVVHFPFPTPPDEKQMCAAERQLVLLGALEPPPRTVALKNSRCAFFSLSFKSSQIFCKGSFDFIAEKERSEWVSKITPLGRAMAALPLAPRYSKMLLLSQQHDLMQLTVTLVAALSVQELLQDHSGGGGADGAVHESRGKWMQQRRSWAGAGNSLLLGDAMILLRAVGAAEYAGATDDFCQANGIRTKALREIRKLRVQLTNEVNLILPKSAIAVDPRMPPPTDEQAKLLRQILLSGSPDHVARRIDKSEIKQTEDQKKFRNAYRCPEIEDPVFLNNSSKHFYVKIFI